MAVQVAPGWTAIYDPKTGNLVGFKRPDGTFTTQAAQTIAADTAAASVKPFLTPEQQTGKIDSQAATALAIGDIDQGLDTSKANTEYETGYTDKDGVFHKGEIDRNLDRDLSTTVNTMIGRGLFRSSIKDGATADLIGTAERRRTYLQGLLTIAQIAAGNKKQILQDQDTKKFGPGGTYDLLAGQNQQTAIAGLGIGAAVPNKDPGPMGNTPGAAQGTAKPSRPSATPAPQNPAHNAPIPPGGTGAAGGTGGTGYNPAPPGTMPAWQQTGAAGFGPSGPAQGTFTPGALAPKPPKNVVKDGKFYHVYNYGTPQEKWVYVRPASG